MSESYFVEPMADDPNRDILPVKDGSCYGSARCSNEIDPRERHVVCKLDRYQLENKYLNLLDEVNELKKLTNQQEDKLKRLATKLMRSAATSRSCTNGIKSLDENEKIASLEFENAKLREKANVLKNQLLSHRGPRSPSQCRRVQSATFSGPTTHRSDNGRTKLLFHSQARNAIDDTDAQNYLVKIQELESQRNEMTSRIAELEGQLAVHVTGARKEKVQDNVEYIRMWRQLKQSEEKLASVQTLNDVLHGKLANLKKLFEETTKNNRDITAALVTEKKRLAEMEDQIAKSKDSQLTLRETDERIRDLTNEMKILQQHNAELIALSSKFSQAETENVELKRKIAEHLTEIQSLKQTMNSESANQVALKAVNEQLMKKLETLQKNIDNLTMQLVSFQNRREPRVASTGTQHATRHVDKKIGTSPEISEIRAQIPEKFSSPKRNQRLDDVEATKICDCIAERGMQARRSEEPQPKDPSEKNPDNRTEHGDATLSFAALRSTPTKLKSHTEHDEPVKSISREEMLKLLEQAQINTPLEAQNVARMRQIETGTGESGYTRSTDPHSPEDADGVVIGSLFRRVNLTGSLEEMRSTTPTIRENDSDSSDVSNDKCEQYNANGSSSDDESSEAPKKTKSSDQSGRKCRHSVLKNHFRIADTITIHIRSMTLFNETTLMNDPDAILLYVEYSFLGLRGAEMETVSLAKPTGRYQPMMYDHAKSKRASLGVLAFKVDKEQHCSRRNVLSAMLSGKANPFLRFVVVNEPLPEETNTKECIEVGHADLNIREHVLGNRLDVISLIITSLSQLERLGMLKLFHSHQQISITGIEAVPRGMTSKNHVSGGLKY